MRTPLVPSLPASNTAPNVELVDSERLGRAVHYVLIRTQNRGINKALPVDAHDLDTLIDLLQTARQLLHAKTIPTGQQTPRP